MPDRCRWHTDTGQCLGHPEDTAPPFCPRHLAELQPWINTRAERIAEQTLATRPGWKPLRYSPGRPLTDEQIPTFQWLTAATPTGGM